MELNLGADLSELCRVCTQGVNLLSSENIYAQTSSDTPSIYTKLSAICSQIFVMDHDRRPNPEESLGMPQTVCLDCKSKIESAYLLHQTCIESNHRLRGMLLICPEPTIVKQEFEDMVQEETAQLQEQPFAEVFVENFKIEEELQEEVAQTKEESNGIQTVERKSRKPRQKICKLQEEADHMKEENDGNNTVERKTRIPKQKRCEIRDKGGQDNEESSGNKTTERKPRNPRQYRCELCGAASDNTLGLNKHMKLKHQNEIFCCSINGCNKIFLTEERMERHKLTHIKGIKRTCPTCQKHFKSLQFLREHMNSHTNERPHPCPECGKEFASQYSLGQHRIRHSEKAFACGQCPSKFHTKGALKEHMLTHTKEKNFTCETCGASFKLKHALLTHNMIHTNTRPHGCTLCDKRFRSNDHLRRHMRSHTGEKPFKCSECDRSFSQTNDLVKHSKTHFGDKPYKCDRCEASFRLLTELRNHYKVHFQPGENGDAPDVIRFTSVSILSLRAEQEKKRGDLKDKQQSDATQDDDAMVQKTISNDLSELPMETDNKI